MSILPIVVDVPLEYKPATAYQPLTSPRTEDYYVEHLDENENILGILYGVTGGSIDANANRPKRRSGQITLDSPADIAWAKDRLRVWKTINNGEFSAPLGTFVISAPEQAFRESGIGRSIELIDKIDIMESQRVVETFTVQPQQNVISVVLGLIGLTGESNISVTTSNATVSSARQWQAGTSLLEIVNDLLSGIQYWALHCDRMGAFQIIPYVAPRSRPTAYRFIEGPEAIHLPTWKLFQDLYKVPNRVTMRTGEDENGDVMEAVATNTNPDSPTSYQANGNRWKDMVVEGIETDSQATLQSMAERRLLDNSSPPTAVTLSHAFLPDLELNDLVELTSQGYQGFCTISNMKISLTPGSLVASEWREVANI